MKYVFWLYWSKTKKILKIDPSIKKLWGFYGFFFLEHITGYTLYELAGDGFFFLEHITGYTLYELADDRRYYRLYALRASQW